MMLRPPHIIVLILDALRAGNVSGYGYPVKTTPHLDGFAAENVLFRRAFSAATWTVPSHASLLSGLYVSQHRIESLKADRRFNEAIVTLPDALRSRGYRTAAFSQNMLFSPANHLDRGFDEFHNVEEFFGARRLTRLIQRLADGSGGPGRLAARYVRKMIAPRLLLDNLYAWIQANAKQTPVFLFANILAPHFPWTVPPRFLPRDDGFHLKYLLNSDFLTLKKQWEFNAEKRAVTDKHRRIWRLLYDASIRHVDSEVGRFLNRLRQWEGWPNAIVVVTADHGEMMGDYRDIVGHMLCLHDNLIHVPLLVRHPEYPQGLKVEGVVQTLDLYPTILEWAGVPLSQVASAQVRRLPLSKAMAAANDPGGFAFAEEDYTDSYDVIGKLLEVNPMLNPAKFPRQQIAVRSANYKYIWYNDRPAEFYNLADGPGEEHNLINGNVALDRLVLQEHEAALQAWRSGLEIFPPSVVDDMAEVDPETVERLRALGYVP